MSKEGISKKQKTGHRFVSGQLEPLAKGWTRRILIEEFSDLLLVFENVERPAHRRLLVPRFGLVEAALSMPRVQNSSELQEVKRLRGDGTIQTLQRVVVIGQRFPGFEDTEWEALVDRFMACLYSGRWTFDVPSDVVYFYGLADRMMYSQLHVGRFLGRSACFESCPISIQHLPCKTIVKHRHRQLFRDGAGTMFKLPQDTVNIIETIDGVAKLVLRPQQFPWCVSKKLTKEMTKRKIALAAPIQISFEHARGRVAITYDDGKVQSFDLVPFGGGAFDLTVQIFERYVEDLLGIRIEADGDETGPDEVCRRCFIEPRIKNPVGDEDGTMDIADIFRYDDIDEVLWSLMLRLRRSDVMKTTADDSVEMDHLLDVLYASRKNKTGLSSPLYELIALSRLGYRVGIDPIHIRRWSEENCVHRLYLFRSVDYVCVVHGQEGSRDTLTNIPPGDSFLYDGPGGPCVPLEPKQREWSTTPVLVELEDLAVNIMYIVFDYLEEPKTGCTTNERCFDDASSKRALFDKITIVGVSVLDDRTGLRLQFRDGQCLDCPFEEGLGQGIRLERILVWRLMREYFSIHL